MAQDELYFESFPNAKQFAMYQESVSFRLPQTTTPISTQFTNSAIPAGISLQSITINAVEGLPQGFNWSGDRTKPMFYNESSPNTRDGCLSICGVFPANGTYSLTVKMTLATGIIAPISFDYPIYITVNDSIAYTTAIENLCSPTTVTLNNVIQSVTNYTVNHNWNFDNGNTSSSSNPAPQTYTNAGVYTIIDTSFVVVQINNTFLQSVNVHGVSCSDAFNAPDLFVTLSKDVNTIVDQTPFVSNTALPVAFNYSQTTNGLLLDPNTTYSIQIQDDDAVLNGLPGPEDCGTVTFNTNDPLTTFTLTNGGLTISVNLVKEDYISSIDTIITTTQFTVNAAPLLSVNNGTICSGNSFTISPSGSATSYTFSSGSSVVSPTISTTYTVIGSDDNDCKSIPAESFVTVNYAPNITVTSSNSLICSGENVTLSANSSATSFTWQPGNLTGSSINVMPNVTSTYSVFVSDNGCDNNAQIIQNVTSCTSLEELKNQETTYLVYPNPTNDFINIESKGLFNLSSIVSIEIANTLGEVLLNEIITSHLTTLNTEQLPAGLYLIKIYNNNNKYLSTILIKQ
jgi:hypothetical protein